MGNRFGWILAIMIVLVLAAVILPSVVFPEPSPPTAATLRDGALDLIDLPWPDELAPAPAQDGNAGEDYSRAAALAAAEEIRAAVQSRQAPVKASLAKLEAIHAAVASGTAKRHMQYVLVHEPKALKVAFAVPAGDELTLVARALELLAEHRLAAGDAAGARTVLLDELAMGYHMAAERALPYMTICGVSVQRRALGRLAAMATAEPAQVAAIRAYADKVARLGTFCDDKLRTVWTPKPNPGDLFNVVENDRDRSWRVQGILTLGIVRYTAVTRGDIRKTDKLLRHFAYTGDALERSAAEAAMKLGEDEFRRLGVMGN